MGSMLSQPAIPRIHYASTPTYFGVRTKNGDGDVQRVSLRHFLESKCPSLLKPYNPAWWLFNGHAQTIFCVVGNFAKVNKIVYERTYIRLADGGTVGLDFTPSNTGSDEDTTPIVVVLHGLTGGSHESYVRAILEPACTPVEKGGLGYRGVVVNFRGCAGTPVTSPQLYSAGHTDDFRTALIYIRSRFPSAPLVGVGFSLGGNVLTRYIAEEGDASRLVAGCALGCPWNLRLNNDALNSGFLGYWIYSKGMGGNLQKLARRHAKSLLEFSQTPIADALVATLALKKPTISDFDQSFTRIGGGSAPNFPFDSANAYYDWASSHKVLRDIRIPFLAVNSRDDPVVQEIPDESSRENGYVSVVLTDHGGHLGWFESAPEEGRGEVRRWITKPVLEWIRATAEEVVDESKPAPIYEQDGILKQEGRDDLGCRKLADGGVIEGVDGEGGLLQGL